MYTIPSLLVRQVPCTKEKAEKRLGRPSFDHRNVSYLSWSEGLKTCNQHMRVRPSEGPFIAGCNYNILGNVILL